MDDLQDHQTLRPRAAQPGPARCNGCAFRDGMGCHLLGTPSLSGVRQSRLRRFARHDTIFEEGAPGWTLGVVARGYVRKVRLTRDGRRTVLGMAMPGDIIGELPGPPGAYSLEAATDTDVCLFDGQTVQRKMATDGPFRRRYLEQAEKQHAAILDMIWWRGALASRERILAFLVLAAGTMPVEPLPDGSLVVTIELCRRDWADLSNTSVESISRTMSQLAQTGLVQTLGRNRYNIRDLAALTRMAGLDERPACARRMNGTPAYWMFGGRPSRHRLTAINARAPVQTRLKHIPDTPHGSGPT